MRNTTMELVKRILILWVLFGIFYELFGIIITSTSVLLSLSIIISYIIFYILVDGPDIERVEKISESLKRFSGEND